MISFVRKNARPLSLAAPLLISFICSANVMAAPGACIQVANDASNCVTQGEGALAGGSSVAIGAGAIANGAEDFHGSVRNGIAVGPHAAALLGGVAIGEHASATSGVALGRNARVTGVGGGVAIGNDSFASDAEVSVGNVNTGLSRRIVNVMDGRVGVGSKDAINGEQLFYVASSIGGGMNVKNGVLVPPVFHMQGGTQSTVGDALNVLDHSVDALKHSASTSSADGTNVPELVSRIDRLDQMMARTKAAFLPGIAIHDSSRPAVANGGGSVAVGGGALADAENSVALGQGSVANEANTVSIGAEGQERRLTNLAAGRNATDAVNMQQFQQGMQQVQRDLSSVARGAYSGVAAATALTMIPDVDLGKTLAIGVGAGTYKGYQAVALGASARISANLKVKIGAGHSADGTSVGCGVSYQW